MIPPMAHFFEKRDPWGNGLALWVLLCMAFVLPLALWGLTRVRLENDVDKWLSDENLPTRQFNWYQKHFRAEDGFLLTWDGSHIDDPRVEEFAKRLVGTPDAEGIRRDGLKQIESVRTPRGLMERMYRAEVTPEQALRRVQGVLVGPGNLQLQLTEFGLDHQDRVVRLLGEGAAREFGLVIEALPPTEEWFSADDLSAASADADSSGEEDGDESTAEPVHYASAHPHNLQLTWSGMHAGPARIAEFADWACTLRLPAIGKPEGELVIAECSLYPGTPAALAVSLTEAGMADLKGTFEQVREVAVAVGIEPARLRMGGSPVATCELNHEVLDAVWNRGAPWYRPDQRSVIALSGLLGILLAFWLLRSVRLAILVLVVSYYATIVSVALVPATGGTFNMVLVVMPTLLLVITISGTVHLANYWKHEAHQNPGTAIVRAIEAARKPCLLAAVTTAIGLASLMSSNLTPVRDFGFYSAVGTLLSVVAVLYALPALLQIWPGAPPPATLVDRQGWLRFGQLLVRHATVVMVVCVVGFAVCAYGLRWFRTETKVIRYFANDSRVVRDYRFLEENLAGIVPVETVVRFGRDAQDELNFLERMEIVREIQTRMRGPPDISGTISLADFYPAAPPLPETATFREKLQRNARSKAVEERFRKESEAATLMLSAPEASEFNEAGDELWRITAQVAIMSQLNYADLTAQLDEICQSVTKYHPGTRHVVTGMVPLFLATQQAVLDSLVLSFCVAFGIIAVVMIAVLRHPVAGGLSMLPNIMPVGVVFGLISWSGIAVDIGTMITASVALGIAVDGTLHMLTWFQRGIAEGMTREKATEEAIGHCGPAMWQTSAVVGLGLLVLYPAELLLISRFGWLMASLIFAALIGDIVFLPALLAGPLGRTIQSVCTPAAAAVPVPAVPGDVAESPAPHVHSSAGQPHSLGRGRRVDTRRGRSDTF